MQFLSFADCKKNPWKWVEWKLKVEEEERKPKDEVSIWLCELHFREIQIIKKVLTQIMKLKRKNSNKWGKFIKMCKAGGRFTPSYLARKNLKFIKAFLSLCYSVDIKWHKKRINWREGNGG